MKYQNGFIIIVAKGSSVHVQQLICECINPHHPNSQIVLVNNGHTQFPFKNFLNNLKISHKNVTVIHYNEKNGNYGAIINQACNILKSDVVNISVIESEDVYFKYNVNPLLVNKKLVFHDGNLTFYSFKAEILKGYDIEEVQRYKEQLNKYVYGTPDIINVNKSSQQIKNNILPSKPKQALPKSLMQYPEVGDWYLRKLPRTLHLYWGNERVSFLRYMTVYSFMKLNPSWTVKLYVPKYLYMGNITWYTGEQKESFIGEDYTQQLFKLVNPIYVDFSEIGFFNDVAEVFKSDFLRWHLLSTEGGFWSDMDILYIQSMNNFVFNTKENRDIDTLVCAHPSGTYHSIGFLAGSQNNPLYEFLLERAHELFNVEMYQAIGNRLFRKSDFNNIYNIKKAFPQINLANIPMDVVYHLDSDNIYKIYHANQILPDNAIGIHWYGGHELSFNHEMTLTESNYKSHQILLTEYIMQVKTPKVSVVMTTFNRAELLRWGLLSISKQEKLPFDYEILVVNDGFRNDDTNKVCEEFRDKLNIKYIFTGHRHDGTDEPQWRIPGFAINIALKKATGDVIILCCPEMYHMSNTLVELAEPFLNDNKLLTIPGYAKDDTSGEFLKYITANDGNYTQEVLEQSEKLHNVRFPFLMGISRDELLALGGYDEDFIGIGFDDNDIMARLTKVGCKYHVTEAKTIHLYHPRWNPTTQDIKDKFAYNNHLLNTRTDQLVRNVGREWGVLHD